MFSVPGVTADTTITSATFSFGTTAGGDIPGVPPICRSARSIAAPLALGNTVVVQRKFDPEDWKFPPKPRWMRWNTYRRYEEKFDNYEGILNDSLFAKLGGL